MRRFLSVVILYCLLLCGCSVLGERIKEPVTFYYLRSEYTFFAENGVFVPEEREASGHRDDLGYLLKLYLMGPADDELASPLPRGTRITGVERTDSAITIQLSDNTLGMSDVDFSLAAGCLSLTCFDITQTDSVTVTCAERSVTMSRDNLILYDSNSSTMEETK